MKKKALIITRNFPPHVGGMERFVWHVYQQLQPDYLCDVVGPRGADDFIMSPQKKQSPPRPASLPVFLLKAMFGSMRLASKNRYSVCIAGSGITAPIANLVGLIFSVPVVTFVYGLDLVVDNKIYQSLFVPSIKHSDQVVAISNSTARLAEEKSVPGDRLKILYPGVAGEPPEKSIINFREKYNLQGRKILLSVGRLIPRKGLPEFVDYSLPSIVEKCPETILVIIGSEAKDALKKDQGVEGRIRAAVSRHKLEDNVLITGRVADDVVWGAYKESDLFVFPLRQEKGDVEGFGLVALEAASCGLPTAAFAVGGVVDAVSPGYSGFLVPGGEYGKFSDVISDYLKNKSSSVTAEACKQYARDCSWDKFGQGLREICNDLQGKRS